MVKNIIDREELQEYLNSKSKCIHIISIDILENKLKIDNQVYSKGWYMRMEYYDGTYECSISDALDGKHSLKKKQIEVPADTEIEKIYDIIKSKAESSIA